MRRRWYHNADFMVRAKNAMNTLLVQLMGFMIPTGLKLVDLLRKDDTIPTDYIMLFGMFFACYLLVVYFREVLPMGDLEQQQERAQLDAIRRIAQDEINKRIEDL